MAARLLAAGGLLASSAAAQAASAAAPQVLGSWEPSSDDLQNTESLMEWLGDVYHSPVRQDPTLWSEVTAEMGRLASQAMEEPALSFAVGNALYSYFWWQGRGGQEVNAEAGEVSRALFERSAEQHGCGDPEMPLDAFLGLRCHIRWRQLLLLSSEVARHLAVEARDIAKAAQEMRRATRHFDMMRRMPLFQQLQSLGTVLRRPHDISFNADHYPHVSVGPVWPVDRVPLAKFMEDHYEEFKADLMRINDPQNFWRLHREAFISETQFTPRDEDWQTVYLYVNNRWVDKNCEVAQRTCELLRTRPEISGCQSSSAGSGFLRLRPGARLKPHYGNSPRLSVHLGLVVPEDGDIHMHVGGETLRWTEGRAIVFDDTYIHMVRHDGTEPRFVINAWFCHPCDSEHWDNPPERQIRECRWPR